MPLWCANALPLNTAGMVGIVCEAESQGQAWEELTAFHPDKHILQLMDWCPCWIGEIWDVWRKWHHIRGHASLLLHPFETKPWPVYDTYVLIDVKAFREQYDPFALSEWIWGTRVNYFSLKHAFRLVRGMLNTEAWCNTRYAYSFRAKMSDERRIAYLACRSDDTPVQICRYFTGTGHVKISDWIIGDGTHRFAAAIVRGDSVIAAVTTESWAERLIKDGLAKRA